MQNDLDRITKQYKFNCESEYLEERAVVYTLDTVIAGMEILRSF